MLASQRDRSIGITSLEQSKRQRSQAMGSSCVLPLLLVVVVPAYGAKVWPSGSQSTRDRAADRDRRRPRCCCCCNSFKSFPLPARLIFAPALKSALKSLKRAETRVRPSSSGGATATNLLLEYTQTQAALVADHKTARRERKRGRSKRLLEATTRSKRESENTTRARTRARVKWAPAASRRHQDQTTRHN